jgi:hypothetical protein
MRRTAFERGTGPHDGAAIGQTKSACGRGTGPHRGDATRTRDSPLMPDPSTRSHHCPTMNEVTDLPLADHSAKPKL